VGVDPPLARAGHTIRIYTGILRDQEMDAASMMRNAPLFAGVPTEQLEALLTASRRWRFGRGMPRASWGTRTK
jgi:hypothetical protein